MVCHWKNTYNKFLSFSLFLLYDYHSRLSDGQFCRGFEIDNINMKRITSKKEVQCPKKLLKNIHVKEWVSFFYDKSLSMFFVYKLCACCTLDHKISNQNGYTPSIEWSNIYDADIWHVQSSLLPLTTKIHIGAKTRNIFLWKSNEFLLWSTGWMVLIIRQLSAYKFFLKHEIYE